MREDGVMKELWKKEFRMSVETFQYLLGLIGVIYSVLIPVFEKLSKLKKD